MLGLIALCCWSLGAPQKLGKSHWCVPFTATFSKRRKIGASWSERCDASKLQPAKHKLFKVSKTHQPCCANKGYAAPSSAPCQCNTWRSPSKLKSTLPQAKINVTSKSPVGDISVVTLIRTDTTLDHSQEAEKVWHAFLCATGYRTPTPDILNVCCSICQIHPFSCCCVHPLITSDPKTEMTTSKHTAKPASSWIVLVTWVHCRKWRTL